MDNIEKWFLKEPFEYGLDDIAGYTELKKELKCCMEKASPDSDACRLFGSCERVQSLFCYGLPGAGKTYIIKAFMSDLMRKYGFHGIFVNASDILSNFVGEAEKRIATVFKAAMDHEPCVIYIDDMDMVCRDLLDPSISISQKYLTVAFLEAWCELTNKESDKPVIFIGASNFPKMVDLSWTEKVKNIIIPLPALDARIAFFKEELKEIQLAEELSLEEIADAAENYNFQDMRHLCDDLKHEFASRCMKLASEQAGTDDDAVIEKIAVQILGEMRLDKETFYKVKEQSRVCDKTEVLKELETFESRNL